MDLKKDFNVRYEPRKKNSKFILFAELQKDSFAIEDDEGIRRFGSEVLQMDILHPTRYFEKYDVLYYEDFNVMVKDMTWLANAIGDRPTNMAFHEIDNIDDWEAKAKEFEKNIKNSSLLLSHQDYKYTYDLIWR